MGVVDGEDEDDIQFDFFIWNSEAREKSTKDN